MTFVMIWHYINKTELNWILTLKTPFFVVILFEKSCNLPPDWGRWNPHQESSGAGRPRRTPSSVLQEKHGYDCTTQNKHQDVWAGFTQEQTKTAHSSKRFSSYLNKACFISFYIGKWITQAAAASLTLAVWAVLKVKYDHHRLVPETKQKNMFHWLNGQHQ